MSQLMNAKASMAFVSRQKVVQPATRVDEEPLPARMEKDSLQLRLSQRPPVLFALAIVPAEASHSTHRRPNQCLNNFWMSTRRVVLTRPAKLDTYEGRHGF